MAERLLTSAPRPSAGGGRRARLAQAALVAGVVLLAIAAMQTLTGVEAQAAARAQSLVPASTRVPQNGDLVARIRIPRIGLDLAVFEGVSAEVLRTGPGHVPGTGIPGGKGNCVIAGHRDSFFRPLAKVRAGDLVYLSGETGERKYRLARRRIIKPTEASVMAATPTERLTLLTCYPFSWIGPAPYRVVWEAVPVTAPVPSRNEAAPASVSTR